MYVLRCANVTTEDDLHRSYFTDELVMEVVDAELDTVKDTLPRLMSGVAELSVPLVVDVGVGLNRDKAH